MTFKYPSRALHCTASRAAFRLYALTRQHRGAGMGDAALWRPIKAHGEFGQPGTYSESVATFLPSVATVMRACLSRLALHGLARVDLYKSALGMA